MKISKVDHRRTAVAIKDNNVKGIIYKVPGQANDASVVIKELVNKARLLYSPLNQSNIDTVFKNEKKNNPELLRSIKTICNNLKYYVQSNINDNSLKNNGIVVFNRPDRFYEINNISEEKKNELTNRIVDNLLKKSLQREVTIDNEKYKLSEIVKELINASCYRYDKNAIEAIDSKKLYALYSTIIEDRDRKKLMKNVQTSLNNQTVKTKISNNDDEVYIALSSHNNKKKDELSRFLIEYASSNNNEEKIIEIKKLIVLFVCGKDEYLRIKDDNTLKAWGFDGYMQNPSALYVQNGIEYFENKKDKKLLNELKIQIRKRLIESYRESISVLNDESKTFWIKHFQNTTETFFGMNRRLTKTNLTCQKVCEHTFNELQSYLATKYIDLGKGVYHFAMPDLYDIEDKEVKLGIIEDKDLINGLTSFDYERIKAEETLNRNISTSATFAVNNFAKSAFKTEFRLSGKENEDVLLYNRSEKYANATKDSLKEVLRYFGGESNFKYLDLNKDDTIYAFKDSLYNIRNSSFHYTSKGNNNVIDENNPSLKIFNYEYKKLNEVYGTKYFSNNLVFFYKLDDIYGLMQNLYSKENRRIAQIPSFNTVIKRKDIDKFYDINTIDDINSTEGMIEKYRSALYYALKEIYYNSFLQDQNKLRESFNNIINNWNDEIKELKNEVYNLKSKQKRDKQKIKELESLINPKKSFINRIREINKNHSFSEMCQIIMTDYNQQNQSSNDKSIKSTEQKKKAKKNGTDGSYEHFPILLRQVIAEMFKEHLTKEEYAFLFKPSLNYKDDTLTADKFNAGVREIKTYINLKENILKQRELLDWYVLAHFLTPKQLNFLIGDIRNYNQFITDINSRSKNINNRIEKETNKKVNYFESIIKVLEFSLLFVAKTSNNITDYYDSNDDYAKYLSNFVNFKGNTFNDLVKFHEIKKDDDTNSKMGLYCDALNPIVNRNVSYSAMYGNSELLAKCLADNKIDENYINNYFSLKNKLEEEGVFKNNKCTNQEQQNNKVLYNIQKNRIELQSLATFTDIINDFMSQLVSYAYLRERDLMYFQLGVAYLRLFYGNESLDESFRKLRSDEFKLNISEGAILYQIVALYTYNLRLYQTEDGIAVCPKDRKGKPTNGLGTAGTKIPAFIKQYGVENYSKCLELFEILDNHEALIDFRDSIDHMKYIVRQDFSIMEYMSVMYKHFLIYDIKLKKSVSFIFKNILLRHHVVAETQMVHDEVIPNADKKSMNILRSHILRICDDDPSKHKLGLGSDKFTYKLKDENDKEFKVECSVHDKTFLNQLRKILEYKEECL